MISFTPGPPLDPELLLFFFFLLLLLLIDDQSGMKFIID
jgi:hypothetical protein